MKLSKLITCFLVVFSVFFLALSCGNPLPQSENEVLDPESLAGNETMISASPVPNIFTDVGQVKYINLEGGFFGIIGSRGNYDPINLPKEFAVDGLWVIFQAEYVKDIASIHMWGTIIKIIKIEKLQGKIISDIGVVKQIGIQGNPFIIEGVKGTYQPINLPDKYRVPGLRVKFTARLRPDIVIIPALWPVIEILTISVVSEPIPFKLGEEFKLQVKQSAINKDAAILFTFESVLSDSRCPKDVVCVWEGEAVVSVNITIGGNDYGSYKLSTRQGANSVIVGKLSFTFLDLYPVPVASSVVSQAGYVGYFLIDYARMIEPGLPSVTNPDLDIPKMKPVEE
jgi:hypothetical protein